MTKQLTPLKAFNRVRYDLLDVMTEYHKSLFDIIENELKDSEKYKTIYSLMKVKLDKVSYDKLKLLNVIEIIKDYELDMKVIIYCIQNNIDYTEYVERELWVEAQDKSPMEPMPQEAFELLKEVFESYGL